MNIENYFLCSQLRWLENIYLSMCNWQNLVVLLLLAAIIVSAQIEMTLTTPRKALRVISLFKFYCPSTKKMLWNWDDRAATATAFYCIFLQHWNAGVYISHTRCNISMVAWEWIRLTSLKACFKWYHHLKITNF